MELNDVWHSEYRTLPNKRNTVLSGTHTNFACNIVGKPGDIITHIAHACTENTHSCTHQCAVASLFQSVPP